MILGQVVMVQPPPPYIYLNKTENIRIFVCLNRTISNIVVVLVNLSNSQ